MAFWGVYLKPNEPYTLHYDNDAVPKRLRITQATLGDATRNSPARSIVRCLVGDKPAIAICSLSVRELTCCQLDLEFEESNNVIFSVMGPRGVYLAGYLSLTTSAPTAHYHTIGHGGQCKAAMDDAGCSDNDLHQDELDFNKTESGLVKESTKAQNADIDHCDKKIKGKHLLKCCKDKKKQGKIIISLDHKMRKDGNQDSRIGSHEKYINRQQLYSSNEDQEKSIAVKTHSVFGRFLEVKRDAIERKKKKRNRKMSKGNVEDDSSGKVKEKKISKIVFTKKMIG